MPLIYGVPISRDSGMRYIHSSIIDRASVALRINTEFKSSLKKDTFCSSTTKRNHAMTKNKSDMHSCTQCSGGFRGCKCKMHPLLAASNVFLCK